MLSACFSGTEIAFFSLSKLQLRRIKQQNLKKGKLVNELLEGPQRLLSTILFGNTLANIAAAILGYYILRQITPERAETLAVPVLTIVIVICGEVIPKAIVIRRPEYYAALLALPIKQFEILTRGVRIAFEAISDSLVKLIERSPYFANRPTRSSSLTEDEYRTLLRASERAGIVHKDEHQMVHKILGLETMQVKEVMTPRVDMQCVEDTLSSKEMVIRLRQIKHRRVPVIHQTPDTVEGILNVKEFLINPQADFDEMVEFPNFIPETMNVATLLKKFRKQDHPIAIVVDEHGGTQGMVTLEDVLEEIVGEIEDEFDKSEIMVQQLGHGRYLVNGKARLEVVNECCGLSLDAEDVDTIAGWLIERLGSLPHEGQQIKVDELQITARKVLKNRVREVLLQVNGE